MPELLVDAVCNFNAFFSGDISLDGEMALRTIGKGILP